jgi:Flp pilus assembly protein CpaB
MLSTLPAVPPPYAGPAEPRPLAGLRSTVRRGWRRVLARRRPLAALCAALAVFTAVRAASAEPAPAVEVLVAAADLPGGSVVEAQDVTLASFRADSVPSGTLRSPPDAVGRVLAAPVRAGEALTDVRLVAPGLLDGYPGLVATPVRVADAASVALLRVGDRVDLVAADPEGRGAEPVARGAPVIALPRATGVDQGFQGGGLLVVAVPEGEALTLARAAVSQVLSYVLSPS